MQTDEIGSIKTSPKYFFCCKTIFGTLDVQNFAAVCFMQLSRKKQNFCLPRNGRLICLCLRFYVETTTNAKRFSSIVKLFLPPARALKPILDTRIRNGGNSVSSSLLNLAKSTFLPYNAFFMDSDVHKVFKILETGS